MLSVLTLQNRAVVSIQLISTLRVGRAFERFYFDESELFQGATSPREWLLYKLYSPQSLLKYGGAYGEYNQLIPLPIQDTGALFYALPTHLKIQPINSSTHSRHS